MQRCNVRLTEFLLDLDGDISILVMNFIFYSNSHASVIHVDVEICQQSICQCWIDLQKITHLWRCSGCQAKVTRYSNQSSNHDLTVKVRIGVSVCYVS